MTKGGYTPGDSASVILTERAPDDHYASFNVNTSTPTAFNAVVTLQPDSRRIDKDKALHISFDYDPNYHETYFIMAQNDKPVLIESTTGSFFLITKSALSFLEVGKAVNYYIARGDKDCFRNNTSSVCIKKLLVASGGGLKVFDSSE